MLLALAIIGLPSVVAIFSAARSFVTAFETRFIDRVDPEAVTRLDPPPRRVVIVVVDGLAAYLLSAENAPNLSDLENEGVRAAAAITVDAPVTIEAFGSLITSRPPEAHGLTGCSYRPDFHFEVPTLFDICAEHELRCGFIATKPKLVSLVYDEPGAERYRLARNDETALEAALVYMADRQPDITIVHLAEVDRAGHTHGWGSKHQRERLAKTDAALLRFVKAARPIGLRPLHLIVLGDHGGLGRSHGSARPENLEIPWFAWSPHLSGAVLREEVSILDTAPTALDLLEIPAPASWHGRSHGEAIRRSAVSRTTSSNGNR